MFGFRRQARAVVDRYFQIVELTDREVGVVYKQGRVAGVLAPGRRQLYWRGPIEVRVEKYDLTEQFELPKALAAVLARAKQPLAAQVADAVTAIEVPDTSVGLLIVDGEFARVLEPGLHAFWKFQRALKSELVDRRVQAMEVQGQEILTRDKGEPPGEPDRALASAGCGQGALGGEPDRRHRLQGAAVRTAGCSRWPDAR